MGGTNDLAETSPNKIVSNLMLLHHHAKAAGAVSVAVAIPKHGALVCKKYEDAMGKNAARHLRHKINTVNHTLQQAVAQANAQDENGGWITYVDAHSEVLNRVGDNPQVALDLFAGFPTLGQYRDFMLLTARSQGNRALQKVQRAFAGFTKEELGKDINHTAQGEQIRMNSPGTWSMMEDPLHFSPEGYRAFAEAMHRMVGEHIKSGFNAFTQRRASKAGPSIGLSDEVGPKKRFMSDLTPNVPTFASRQPRVSLRAASSSEQRTLSLQPSSEKQQQQQQLPLSRSSSSSGPQQQLAPIIPGYTPNLSNTQMSSGSRM